MKCTISNNDMKRFLEGQLAIKVNSQEQLDVLLNVMLSYGDNFIKIVANHDYLECDYKEEFHYYFITRYKDLDAVREMKYLDGSYPSVPISKPICEYKDMGKAESDA